MMYFCYRLTSNTADVPWLHQLVTGTKRDPRSRRKRTAHRVHLPWILQRYASLREDREVPEVGGWGDGEERRG